MKSSIKTIFLSGFLLMSLGGWASSDWKKSDNYSIKVHSAFEETVQNLQGKMERIFYLDVECQNNSKKTASCHGGQWQVFDENGFVYEREYLPSYLYGDRGKNPLLETVLVPGMNVRGWLAFKIPEGKKIKKFQFFSGYLSQEVVQFEFNE